MTKLSKIIYIVMAIIGVVTFIVRLITKDYVRAMDEFALMCWVGVAFMNEMRCVKLQKKIDEMYYGNN